MYNPYDMVPMVINGEETVGRPIEFDAPIADFDKMEDGFGNQIKPIKLSTTCPGCGQGLIVTVTLLDPPFSPVRYSCEYCAPVEQDKTTHDPFTNPIETGQISQSELDPLLHGQNEQVVPSEGSVADDWPEDTEGLLISLTEEIPSEASVDSPEDSETEIDEDLVAALEPKKSKKKPRKSKAKTKSKVEPADGLDEEIFDDSDLAE